MPVPPAAPHSSPSRHAWLLLAAGLLFGLVWCLGSRGLNEPDEGRYASMGLAMVRSGDWWEPRLSGYGHYDKPPLVYWATAASLRAFGLNEWAARLPPLLGAALALAGLGWAAARLYGGRVAWWAVLVCGTMVQFWVCARVLTPDMLLTGWCALAIGAWAECRRREGAWRWWAVSLGFWTLAWWTKATPALVPLLGLALGTWWTGDHAGWRALRLPLLLPALLALGAPWFLAMMRSHPDLYGFFLGRELAGRLAGGVHQRGGWVGYYFPVSAVCWLPWWPLAAWTAWRRREPGLDWREGARRIGVEGWIVGAGLVVFSLVGSKLPTYTLVLAPWAALAMARALAPAAGEAFFPRGALATLGWFAAVMLPAAALAPGLESRLGANSSLREVCAFLRENGAKLALFDRHWPGVEFYLPEPGRVRFLEPGEPLRQRPSDPGPPTPTFAEPSRWREEASAAAQADAGSVWMVRYRKGRKSPFNPAAGGGGKAVVIGDFELRRWLGFSPPAAVATP